MAERRWGRRLKRFDSRWKGRWKRERATVIEGGGNRRDTNRLEGEIELLSLPIEENPIPRISRDELQPLAEIISRFWRYSTPSSFECAISRFVFKNVTKLY